MAMAVFSGPRKPTNNAKVPKIEAPIHANRDVLSDAGSENATPFSFSQLPKATA
jgi:hypothetical protein